MKVLAITEIVLDGVNTDSEGLDYGSDGRHLFIPLDDDYHIDFNCKDYWNDFDFDQIVAQCKDNWGNNWSGFRLDVLVSEMLPGKFIPEANSTKYFYNKNTHKKVDK